MRQSLTGPTAAATLYGRVRSRGRLNNFSDVPLLWQHKTGSVIGRIQHLSEDERGLRVIGALGGSADAKRAARLLESGKDSTG